MANPRISVVIVLHNSNAVLPETIEALNRNGYNNLELILVDNASMEKVSEKDIKCRFPLRVFLRDFNSGFGQGCNFGAEQSEGEFILFLNPDARPTPDAVAILAKTMIDNNMIAVVGPQLLFNDGSKMPSYRLVPNFRRLLFSRNSPLSKIPVFSRLTEDYIPPSLAELSEVEVVPATAMMVRRAAFVKVGGFDRRYFIYAEDFDLCMIMRENGYKVFHQPEALVYHSWGKGAIASKRFLTKEHNRSIFRFYRKHYPTHIIRGAVLYILLSLRMLSSMVGIGNADEDR